MLDAVGLASFTVVGVIVAVEERCNPLLVWGPIFSAMTGAGGYSPRRDRADASHPSLHHEFYAEISPIGASFSRPSSSPMRTLRASI